MDAGVESDSGGVLVQLPIEDGTFIHPQSYG